jgi:tellurite resistance protein
MGWLLFFLVAGFGLLLYEVIRRSAPRVKPQGGTRSGEQHRATAAPAHPALAAAPTAEVALRWVGAREAVRLGDLEIRNPVAYFTNSRLGSCDEPAAIDVALPVAPLAYQPQGRELGYWPRYDQLTPGQRRIFLDWVGSGRTVPPPELGYTFLFIYGLERRALIEQTDRRLVFDEVFRLRYMYGDHHSVSRSFDSYTSAFLWFLVARHPEVFELDRIGRLMSSTDVSTQNRMAVALGWFAITATPLPDWAAFLVAGSLNNSQRSVVVSRVNDEFRLLFAKRYVEKFPEGLLLKLRTQHLSFSYKPASAVLPVARVSAYLPNIRPLSSLSEIWNDCIDELRKLSTVRAKQDAATLTVAAWEATPRELRERLEHPHTEAVCRVVAEATDEDGQTLLPIDRIATAAGFDSDGRLSPAQARRFCETVGHIGYCVEPDARLTGRGYNPAEQVAVFLPASDELPDPGRYNAAACMLGIGLAIAKADGYVRPEELSLLLQQVDAAFNLSGDEARRLDALRTLLFRTGLNFGSFRALLKNVPADSRVAIGKLAIALAAADGVVTPEELKAVRSCYAALGFDGDEVERTLRALMSSGDEPVTIRAAKIPREHGEFIPLAPAVAHTAASEPFPPPSDLEPFEVAEASGSLPPKAEIEVTRLSAAEPLSVAGDPAPLGDEIKQVTVRLAPQAPPTSRPAEVKPAVKGLKLDRAAIAAIMKDTQEVAAMLAEAMNVGAAADADVAAKSSPAAVLEEVHAAPAATVGATSDAAVLAAAAAPVVTETSDPSLPQRYAAFYQMLLAKGEWTLSEAETAARGQGHMLSGAIEALNDWAFERYGGQLFVEDGERLTIEIQLLN